MVDPEDAFRAIADDEDWWDSVPSTWRVAKLTLVAILVAAAVLALVFWTP